MKLKWKNMMLGMGIGILILLLAAGIFAVSFYSSFLRASQLTFSQITSLASEGYQKRTLYQNRKIPFLFLGLDRRDDEFEKTLLTDTILLGSIDTSTGNITTIALPRDLWIPELQTKINALYYYGQQRPDSSGTAFTREEISKLSGVNPEFVVTLNYLDLPNLIDLIGGVEVNIRRSFEDARYPNPAYVAGTPGVTLYMTIKFTQGAELMDGNRALSYIRSRESTDPIEGSDSARSERQMIVIQALIKKLKSNAVVQNPKKLGGLYRFWHENVETTLHDSDILAIGINLRNKSVSFTSVQIPVVSTPSQPALLVNPPISKYGLWVWEARDRSWGELREFINKHL